MHYGYTSRTVVGAISAMAGVLLFAGQAFADTTDWSLAAGGTYTSNASTGGDLVGSNIPSLSVNGDGTPAHNGATLLIVDGVLNFTSGSYQGNGVWGTGGTLYLTGCIAGVTATTCTGSNNVDLVSDDFQRVQVESILGSLDVVFGNITGTLNSSVAAYFGVSTTFETASFATAMLSTGTGGSSFSGTNLLGVIKADPPATAMPEHWSIVESLEFFGLTLLVFGALLRFRILRPAAIR